MNYDPPLPQILLAMQAAGRLGQPLYDDVSFGDAEAILEQAARFAAGRIAPLNRVGDENPARWVAGRVVTPPGWQDTYRDWCESGWNGLACSQEHGGQGLPFLLGAATSEMLNAACLAFALCPLLTTGAIESISAHGSDALKQIYLPKMVTGEWSGTMNLTEPHAGSDLSQLRCKATRASDGTYRITGTKIYITYGDHDLTSNIVHLVLARLEGAPAGTKGISLFLVPKILPGGAPNDVRCHALEHKLGIHGSPTCTMIYGDKDGAIGWLIGHENQGLACMFTMMNNARVLVAIQGVALAERALQAAFDYARQRKQGRAPGTEGAVFIINHPDVKRMLLGMRVKTAAARMLCMATASAIDETARATDDTQRNRASAMASLLTPLAKSYATDIAVEVASQGIQVHGGMGFVEATGVAQFYRDARILTIYEGTNGIQAIDLVTRKLTLENGGTLMDAVSTTRQSLADFMGDDAANAAATAMQTLTAQIKAMAPADALAAATPYARALATFIAGGFLARAAKIAESAEMKAEAETNAKYYFTSDMQDALASGKAALMAAKLLADTDLA